MACTPRPRPTRYGHALRRLAAKKTSHINRRVAVVLAQRGLVTLDDPEDRRTAVGVKLTLEGEKAAKEPIKPNKRPR